MTAFIARFNGIERRIALESKIKNLTSLQEEISNIFGIPLGEFKLSYKDVENDEIQIVDQLDFEYFVSLLKEAKLELNVLSEYRPRGQQSNNPFKKDKEGSPEQILENGNEKNHPPGFCPEPEICNPHIEEEFLQALGQDADHKIAEQNLKTLNECLSDAEVLTDLKKKVESIRELMERSVSEMKSELVKAKRKNSGVVNREIIGGNVHPMVTCSNCGLTPINGKRFKCITCKGFDLCEVCEENNFHSHHPMMRLVESVRPNSYYEELGLLIKTAMSNLRTTDLFTKKKLLKSVFGEHVSNDTLDVILNSRGKATAEEVLMEFHKLLV